MGSIQHTSVLNRSVEPTSLTVQLNTMHKGLHLLHDHTASDVFSTPCTAPEHVKIPSVSGPLSSSHRSVLSITSFPCSFKIFSSPSLISPHLFLMNCPFHFLGLFLCSSHCLTSIPCKQQLHASFFPPNQLLHFIILPFTAFFCFLWLNFMSHTLHYYQFPTIMPSNLLPHLSLHNLLPYSTLFFIFSIYLFLQPSLLNSLTITGYSCTKNISLYNSKLWCESCTHIAT